MTVEADNRALESRLLGFIQNELLSPPLTVARDDDLLSGDLLDSVAVLRLSAFVQEEFQIPVQPADFVVENFRNVAVLAAFIRRSDGTAA